MTTISALPDAPNPLTDSQAQFNSKALAFTNALPTLVTEINTVAGEINTAKTAAETAETNAETAETNAEAAQTAAEAAQAAAEAAIVQAQAAANVTEWISGTSYTEGDCVWSPTDHQTYRRIVTGGGTTDPASDPPNWQNISGSPPFSDAAAQVRNSADATKLVRFSAASVTTGTTRVVTIPDENITLAGRGANTFTGDQTLDGNDVLEIKNATFDTVYTIATTTGAITIDWNNAQHQKQTEPTGAITYTFTAPPGPARLQLIIDSDGTSTAQTITWPGSVVWLGETWAGANNKKSLITFWYDGTSYFAMGANQV